MSVNIRRCNVLGSEAGGQKCHLEVVNVVIAVIICISGDVVESNVLTVAGVVVKHHFYVLICGAGIVNRVNSHESGGICRVAHHAHFQLVCCSCLFEPELKHQAIDGSGEHRQGHITAVIHTETVAAAMGIAGTIINLWSLGRSHRHVSRTDSPATGHLFSGGNSAGRDILEIDGIRHRQCLARSGEILKRGIRTLVRSTAHSLHLYIIMGGRSEAGERDTVGADINRGKEIGVATINHSVVRGIAYPADCGTGGGDVRNIHVVGGDTGGETIHLDIVKVVRAVGCCAGRYENIVESNKLTRAGIVVKHYLVVLVVDGVGRMDGVDGNKSTCIVGVIHHTHFQPVVGSGLFHLEFYHQAVNGNIEDGQSHIAAIIQTQAVAAAGGIRGGCTIIYLGRLGSSHRHILGTDNPARRHGTGGSGSARGDAVEVLSVRYCSGGAGSPECQAGWETGVAHAANGAHADGIFSVRGEEHQVDIRVGQHGLSISHDAGSDSANPGSFVACRSESDVRSGGAEVMQRNSRRTGAGNHRASKRIIGVGARP